MNKDQKEKLEAVVIRLSDDIELLEEIQNDWQEVFDERSEKWQESEKGEKWSDRIDDLSTSIEEMQSAMENIDDILNQ